MSTTTTTSRSHEERAAMRRAREAIATVDATAVNLPEEVRDRLRAAVREAYRAGLAESAATAHEREDS